MAATQRLAASRNVTWAPSLAYDYAGGALPPIAHIAMEVRLYPGQAGGAQLSLPNIPFTDSPLSGVAGQADEWRRLSLSPVVSPEVLRTLPGLHTPEAGDPQIFAFDIRITYADGLSEVLSSGEFILSPGVTIV